jgi:sulfur relay (sulfurtransferase) DsrF/TusC family protein
MKPGALFIIQSDPRRSRCSAEAVRIAAGVGAWKKIGVALYLREAAVLVLGEQAEALMDGEDYARYLPVLRELGRPVYVQKGAAALGELGHATLPFEEISDEQLAGLAAAREYVLRF